MNLVAVDVSPRTLNPMEVSATHVVGYVRREIGETLRLNRQMRAKPFAACPTSGRRLDIKNPSPPTSGFVVVPKDDNFFADVRLNQCGSICQFRQSALNKNRAALQNLAAGDPSFERFGNHLFGGSGGRQFDDGRRTPPPKTVRRGKVDDKLVNRITRCGAPNEHCCNDDKEYRTHNSPAI